jgi:exosortase A
MADGMPARADVHASPGSRPSQDAAAWHPALLTLSAGLLPFGLLFADEIRSAVAVWNSSAAYTHCWLVGPIAAWLAWQRRDRLAALTPVPLPAAALLMLPAGVAWLLAERLGVMEGRQLAALGMLWVLLLAVLGWRVCVAMAAPLVYLVFLVPFGEFATPHLQHATAWMIELGLGVLDISYHRDGLMLETTAGLFHVAEACAGLRFLIATLAFGALYAIVMFRSPGRRLAVMALAVTVPVAANGVRALGIVVLAQHLGNAEAAAADHIVYGWGFFAAVLLVLILAGLPFRQDGARDRPRAPPFRPGTRPRGVAFLGAAMAAMLLAAAGPAAAAALATREVAPRSMPAAIAAVPGCTPDPSGTGLDCPSGQVTARLLVFAPRVTWRAVSAARWQVGGGDTALSFTVAAPDGTDWQAWQEENGRVVAVATWLRGQSAGDGMRSRIAQAWNSVAGGSGAPVLAVVEVRVGQGLGAAAARGLLERVLAAQAAGEGLAAQAAARSAAP